MISTNTSQSPKVICIFSIGQPDHLAKLSKLPLDVTFDKLRYVRAYFAWLSDSRPDVFCAVNRSAPVTTDMFSKRHIEELNMAIHHTKTSRDLTLNYGPLDRDSLHLKTYTDASFASNDEHSSQLRFIVLLFDKNDNCHILDYASKKCKRFVGSIMSGETYTFIEEFDHSYATQHTLKLIYNQQIPITMLTDSKQPFDVITKASFTAEKRLMIDISAARES